MALLNEVQAAAAGVGVGVAVVMVPLPAQGHLNQLLHLSHLIAARGIPVYYAGSATHNRQARERMQGWDPSATHNITFHELSLPAFATPAPDPHAPVKFPAHLQPLFDATFELQSPLSSLLQSLASATRRVVVVHDSAMAFIAVAASSISNNVEAYAFHSVSAFNTLCYLWEARGKPIEFDGLNLTHHSFEDCFTDEFLHFLRRQHHAWNAGAGRLLNSCHAIEGRFIDLISQEPGWQDRKTFAIGPLNPVTLKETVGVSLPRHKCLDWLDQQPIASVVYVSFGTMSSLPNEQITELVAGLEGSGQRFICVLRDADRGDIYANGVINDKVRHPELPLGYETRVKGTGIVVRDWVPQLEILAHPATGGFLSHCGWNSCMESMSMGVPLLAWPMHSDQPKNTQLVTEVLKVGIVVRDWSRRHEILPSTVITDSISKLMVDDEAKEIRKRAQALGDAIKQATLDGGTSTSELDSFIAHITS